jgi:hypothetical protein
MIIFFSTLAVLLTVKYTAKAILHKWLIKQKDETIKNHLV